MGRIAFPFFTLIGLAQTPRQSAKKFVECLAGRIGNNGDVIGAPEGKTIGKLVDQKPMSSSFTNFRLIQDLHKYLSEELDISLSKRQLINSN